MKEILKGGKGDNKPDWAFNQKQLRLGMKIEKEHTRNKAIAKEIAKDHLSEDKRYYTHLVQMEHKYKRR